MGALPGRKHLLSPALSSSEEERGKAVCASLSSSEEASEEARGKGARLGLERFEHGLGASSLMQNSKMMLPT